jgi:hypothetical protein
VNDALEPITVRNIVREILRYLDRNPEAKDTIDGMAQWWLRREGSGPVLQDVERAVAWLLAGGFLVETRRPGVPAFYGLNHQQRETIAKLLKGL